MAGQKEHKKKWNYLLPAQVSGYRDDDQCRVRGLGSNSRLAFAIPSLQSATGVTYISWPRRWAGPVCQSSHL